MGLRAGCMLHIWHLLAVASPRLRLLQIRYADNAGPGLDFLLRGHMPILESFAINCVPAEGLGLSSVVRGSFFESAPRLRDCRMRNFTPNLGATDFPALVSLDVSYAVAHGETVPSRTLHNLLHYCRGLQSLKIDVAHLEHDESNRVAYPGIKDLSFIVRNADSTEAIDSFVFPNIERLDLSLAPVRVTRTMVQDCSATLTTLIINKRVLLTASASMLTGASRLESVEFIKCKLAEGFFLELATPLPNGTIACPAWHRLHITQCIVPRVDAFTGDALLQLIRLRNGGAVRRLSDVELSWKDDDVPLRAGFAAELQALLQ
ncbi:hypothetical protein AURDEDRAFT_114724 [Auricularia subglabra TFB-10046 SS5]|nr:hypothetical protein AURDEDRAFT_114724 [Auricularia subglabra TFB-10046 SS5]